MSLLRASFGLILVGLLLSTAVLTPAQKDSRTKDAARHASDAAKTFTEIMNVKDKAIPKELLDTAEAIAVFPGVLKAAFILRARWTRRHQQTRQRRMECSGVFQSQRRQFWTADRRTEN